MPALTKDALLALKPRMEAVAVPELGEGAELYVREMNGLDVLEYGALYNEVTGGDAVKQLPVKHQIPLMQFMLERTLCDEAGELMFADGGAIRAAIPFAVMQRLFERANAINQVDETDAPKKSSDGTPTSTLHVA